MTFREAVEEMKVLAEGREWSFEYEVASYITGCKIHGYIAGDSTGHAAPALTYAGAIENVKVMLGLLPIEMEDPPEDGAPEDD